MASYRVLLKRSATKELEALPLKDRRRVVRRIQDLASEPRPAGCEELSGQEKFRLRQGNYRILYAIDDPGAEVTVVKIGHRRSDGSSSIRGWRPMKKTEHRYEIIIHWSNEDQAYIAEVPELEWCAGDGATYQEAVANVEVVIDEWIETAKEKGWKIPEPKGRRLMYA